MWMTRQLTGLQLFKSKDCYGTNRRPLAVFTWLPITYRFVFPHLTGFEESCNLICGHLVLAPFHACLSYLSKQIQRLYCIADDYQLNLKKICTRDHCNNSSVSPFPLPLQRMKCYSCVYFLRLKRRTNFSSQQQQPQAPAVKRHHINTAYHKTPGAHIVSFIIVLLLSVI